MKNFVWIFLNNTWPDKFFLANASVDEVMMSLIQGYEVFEQTKLVEIKAEVWKILCIRIYRNKFCNFSIFHVRYLKSFEVTFLRTIQSFEADSIELFNAQKYTPLLQKNLLFMIIITFAFNNNVLFVIYKQNIRFIWPNQNFKW